MKPGGFGVLAGVVGCLDPVENDLDAAQDERIAALEAQVSALNAAIGQPGGTGPTGPTGPQGPAGEAAPTVVEVNGELYSVAGFYCGETNPITGNVGGYPAAKDLCEITCGSSSAHVCDGSEMARSAQVGLLEGVTGWYASASFAPYVGVSSDLQGAIQDCYGFTSADDTVATDRPVGALWATQGVPSRQFCSLADPLVCCD